MDNDDEDNKLTPLLRPDTLIPPADYEADCVLSIGQLSLDANEDKDPHADPLDDIDVSNLHENDPWDDLFDDIDAADLLASLDQLIMLILLMILLIEAVILL